nr:MAG TPA: hypothetical protein [Caudoviricetes sp.]
MDSFIALDIRKSPQYRGDYSLSCCARLTQFRKVCPHQCLSKRRWDGVAAACYLLSALRLYFSMSLYFKSCYLFTRLTFS